MFNTTYAKLHIKLSYFFSLNQVLLTALDTFFFGDLITGSASFFRFFFATSLSLRPET